MKKYTSFLKKHKAAKTEEDKHLLLKDFMLHLNADELLTWLNDGNNFIEKALFELIDSGDKENIEYSKKYIHDLETILEKKALVAKAA